jgi:hypothetical protein
MANGSLSPAAPASTAVPEPAAPVFAVDLRPLTTSELIDRGFALYRAHFAGFLLLALLCQSAPLLGQILSTAFKLNPTQTELLEAPVTFLIKTGVLTGVVFLAQIVVFCFEVVITFYIADAYLGKIPSVKKCLRQLVACAMSSIWTCVLNWILIGLTFIFPAIAILAVYLYAIFYPPLTLLNLITLGTAGFVLIVASISPVLIVFMRLMVTVPALALEGRPGWRAIKRSASLVRYDPGLGILYWGEMRLSFLLLPLFIIELLILSLTSLPVTAHQIGEVMRHGSSGQIAAPPDSVMIISQIMTFLAGSLILPLYSIATTLFYYDIRIRREGFDLEFMAAQLEGEK